MASSAQPVVATDRRVRLWDNGEVVVEHVSAEAPAARLVVTFSHHGSNDLDAHGYAERFLRRRGFDVLAVKTARNDWFHPLSLEAMANIRAMLPAYQQVATYGSSMGGYAALYFADAVDAEVAIALSPQYTVDPAVLPEDQRWAGDAATIAFTHQLLAEVLRTSRARPVVLYDPHNPDRIHVEAMRGAGSPLFAVPVRYGGHPVGITLQEIGALDKIVIDLLDGHLPDVRSTMRASRRESPQYLFFLGLSCVARGHLTWADRLFTAAASKDPRPSILIEHSRLLWRRGQPQPALALLQRAFERTAPDTHLLAYQAHLHELCGETDLALAMFDQVIAREPAFTGFYIAERALLRRVLEDQRRRLDMVERTILKLRAERDLEHGPAPGKIRTKEVIALAIVPLLVATLVWVSAYAVGII